MRFIMMINADLGKFKSTIRLLTAKKSGEIVNSCRDDFGNSNNSWSTSLIIFDFSGSPTLSHLAKTDKVVP